MAKNIVAFSGGKDSTALALRLAEMGEDFDLLFTPTGNELPDLQLHINRVIELTGKRLIMPPGPKLAQLIEEQQALPNWRQRWCTRMIKIVPCQAYLLKNPGSTLMVGLRADEEERVGLYGDFAEYRYPLREWGWGIKKVQAYVASAPVKIPLRTDCAICPYQRLGDWWILWKKWPKYWEQGKAWEKQYGHTFRSPSRDTWPASMEGLEREFAKGRKIRGFDMDPEGALSCRVCRM